MNWLRDSSVLLDENGPGCNAVLGISGGKTAPSRKPWRVEALGRNRNRCALCQMASKLISKWQGFFS